MRTSGWLGLGLMGVAVLVASSANTKTAQAHSKDVVGVQVEAPAQGAAPVRLLAPAAPTQPPTLALIPAEEIVTPPPADLNLENPKLRRMRKDEISQRLIQESARIVRQYHAKPVGTQIEVHVEGKHVVARIERHFHPEGGTVKPWGFHSGVSLFVYR